MRTRTRTLPAVAAALALLLGPAPNACRAQAAPDRADRALSTLSAAGIIGAAADFSGYGSGRRPDQAVRDHFAALTAALLGALEDGGKSQYTPLDQAALQARLAQSPPAVAAMSDLVGEFGPELTRRGVDLTATRFRLTALAQGRQLPLSRPFPDVPPDHWAFRSVETLRRAGLISGEPGGRAAR